jgi:hypothetical protein
MTGAEGQRSRIRPQGLADRKAWLTERLGREIEQEPRKHGNTGKVIGNGAAWTLFEIACVCPGLEISVGSRKNERDRSFIRSQARNTS